MHINTIHPHFLLNRTKIALSYALRKSKVLGGPQEISLEITNRCNLKCIMCPHSDLKRPIGDMEFPLFKKIIKEAAGTLELIYLHLAGEPLLHPRLFDMIDICKREKIPVGISTNATLLDERCSRDLIKSGLDYIILSFDGFTPETYENIRRGASFHKTMKNIETFLRLKGKGGKRPFTVVQLVYMEKNKTEMEDFLSFWNKKEIDVVRTKPFINYPGLDLHLSAIKRIDIDEPCFLLWRQMAIYWDGTVSACCFDYIGGCPIGDLKRQSLKEVWNSIDMQEIRKRHLTERSNTIRICANCERPHLNIFSLLGTIIFDGLTLKKILPVIEKHALKGKIKRLSYFSLKE